MSGDRGSECNQETCQYTGSPGSQGQGGFGGKKCEQNVPSLIWEPYMGPALNNVTLICFPLNVLVMFMNVNYKVH